MPYGTGYPKKFSGRSTPKAGSHIDFPKKPGKKTKGSKQKTSYAKKQKHHPGKGYR